MSEEFDDLGDLCAFIVESGGEAYSWKRLKAAIYALSKASSKEPLELPIIFSYSYGSNCYAGPDDTDLKEDLEWLRDAGYVTERIIEIPGASEHNLYGLTEKGRELGLIARANLTEEQRVGMRKVAENFKKLEESSVVKLLAKYASEWEKSQQKLIGISETE